MFLLLLKIKIEYSLLRYMYISFALGLIANTKHRRFPEEYSIKHLQHVLPGIISLDKQ